MGITLTDDVYTNAPENVVALFELLKTYEVQVLAVKDLLADS